MLVYLIFVLAAAEGLNVASLRPYSSSLLVRSKKSFFALEGSSVTAALSQEAANALEAEKAYERAMKQALDEEIKELALPALAGIIIDPLLSL